MGLRLTADTGSVLENGSATGNVLQNDTSAVRVTQIKAGSGAYVSAASGGVTLPGAYGSLAIMQNGSYVYTASAADRLATGSKASDTFTYTAVNASGASASTTLKFSVTGINDAPALMSTTVTLSSITEDQTGNNGQTISSFLKSSDVDSSAARGIAITGLTSANGQWEFSVNGGANWSVVGSVSDSAALLLRSLDLIRFAPNGIDGTAANLTYRAWDQTSGATGTRVSAISNGGETAFSNTAAVASIAVTSVNDAPTGIAASVSATEDSPPITGQLQATDVDSPALRYTLVANSPVGGTVSLDPSTGNYSFALDTNFSGTAFFKFIANDGGLNSTPTDVTVAVSPVNDAPVANADSRSTVEGTPILINVLANDTDVDGDILNIAAVDRAANGIVQIDQGQVRYVPNPGFTGTDSFIYTASDAVGATSSATATITIGPNAIPVTITLDQNYGYGHFRVGGLPANSIIDATKASWIVSNSANQNPDAVTSFLVGSGVINKYPFIIDPSGAGLTIKGGTVWGEVPQISDRQYTYNNSHAIRVDSTANVTIDDWRIDKAWDGIHFRGASGGFLVDDLHISNVRDDAIENDFGLSGTVRDSLFDGVHVGIALDNSTNPDASGSTLTLQNVFMRSQLSLVNGEMTHGSFFKTNTNVGGTNPHIRIMDSVFAIEDVTPTMVARLKLAWEQVVESHGNVFLNLTDLPLPSTYPKPPAGFTILEGQVARDYWEKAEAAWIDNHDGVNDLDLTPLPPLPGVSAADGDYFMN